MVDLEVREIKNKKEWNSFLKSSPQYNIFSSSQWASIVENTTNFKPIFYGCFKNQEMIAGLLVFYLKKGPFKIGHYPPLTPFITPIFSQRDSSKLSKIESYENSVITFFLAKLKKEFSYFIISLHHSIKDFRPFRYSGLKPMIAYTYLLDLSDINKLWENLDKDTKYDINKSKEKGTGVYRSDDITKFYKLYEDTCKRQKMPLVVNKQMLQDILSINKSQIFFAKNKSGKDIASAVIIFDDKKAYYLLAAFDSMYKDNKAPSLVLWEAIKYAAKKTKVMDLVGANTQSVARFKSGFNPKLVPYIQTEYYSSLLFKILYNLYLIKNRRSKTK